MNRAAYFPEIKREYNEIDSELTYSTTVRVNKDGIWRVDLNLRDRKGNLIYVPSKCQLSEEERLTEKYRNV